MSFLPICVNVDDTHIVIVGGGNVALQKAKSVLQYTENITVCAPEINSAIKNFKLNVLERPYSPDVLEGALLVYACTNDSTLNRRIRDDAHSLGIFANVADNPDLSDFISPAIYRAGTTSVAVSSDGKDVKSSVALRNIIRAFLQSGTSVSATDSTDDAFKPGARR